MREACQDIKEIVLAITVTLLKTTEVLAALDHRLLFALEAFKLYDRYDLRCSLF